MQIYFFQTKAPSFFSQCVKSAGVGLVIGLLIPVFLIIGIVGAAVLGLLSLIAPKKASSIGQSYVDKFLDLTKNGVTVKICSGCVSGLKGRNLKVTTK